MFCKTKDPLFLRWREQSSNDIKKQMDAMSNCEAADAFGKFPSFGTGGIRNPEGIGPNRINFITIRWAAAALAEHLLETIDTGKILIGYDTRCNSSAYAQEAALTLNRYGIITELFHEAIPVPLLSFAIRRGDYLGGIMITASHNAPKDNGFKVYSAKGCQLVPSEAAPLEEKIQSIDPFSIRPLSKKESIQQGLFHLTGKTEKAAYLKTIAPIRPTISSLNIVATPLHGAAFRLLPEALKRSGHKVHIVREQMTTDGRFPTIKAPNPEDPAVFRQAKTIGQHCDADLLLATDGDGDRCGCCVKQNDTYIPLSGNDTAAILIDYLIHHKRPSIPNNSYVARTAVSGTIGTTIAEAAGMNTIIVPTGFKYIGALLPDKTQGSFFAGYEESGGFLYSDHAADKDGISTAVLLAKAGAHYKKQGKTLLDRLEEIYSRYGREYTETLRFSFPGQNGTLQKEACLQYFRHNKLPGSKKNLCGDTVFFDFGHDKKAALRLSGTEPYLKLYCIVKAESDTAAADKKADIQEQIVPIIYNFLPQNPQKGEY